MRLPAMKQFDHTELFIRKLEDTHVPLGRQEALDPFDMNICIFPAGAVPHIDTELEHLEPVGQQLFTEKRIGFPVFFGVRRQVK